MAETKRVLCAAGVYTPVSAAGQTSVILDYVTKITGRMVISTSQPTPSHSSYIEVGSQNGPEEVTILGSSDIVYFMPDGTEDVFVKVIAGAGQSGGGGGGAGVGAVDDAPAAADGSGNYSVLSALKRVLLNGAALLARIPAAVNGRIPVDASGKAITANSFNAKLRDAFQTFPGDNWTIAKQAAGDLLFIDGNAGGASYVVISMSPLAAGTETWVESGFTFTMPMDVSFGIHASQRTLGQEFSAEVVSTETPTTFNDIAISAIQQATTTLTVTTTAAHDLRVGQRIGIAGVTDSRLNYPSLVIATTPTPTTFTATAGPGGTIASVTVGPLNNQGVVYLRSALGGSQNGSSQIFENATATNASFYVKAEGGDATPIGGTINGNHSATISTTASAQPINAALNYAFRPSTEFRLSLMADRVQWSDVAADSISQSVSRASFNQIAPNPDQQYKIRFRATNNKALTAPVAKIVSVSKTGTTTATVVTDGPHGLTTGDYVNAFGVRDTTNFANLSAATVVASVVNANTFTVIWGTPATVTSYGGYVSRVQGGQVQQGAIAQVAQSIARTANVVTMVGNAAWSGILIGDTVNIHGVRNAVDGSDLGLDGAYRVRDIQTMSLFLEPLTGAPSGGYIGSVNCGGGVIKRTDYLISFARLFDFERVRVVALARPGSDTASAFPVAVNNTVTITASNLATNIAQIAGATPNASVANGSTNKSLGVTLATAVSQVDVSAAAFAGSGRVNGTVIASTQGGGGVISAEINVTALTLGTATAVIPVLQESVGGSNFTDIWVGDPMTATGIQQVPAIPVAGRRRWAFHSVGGTSTTVTVTITTLELLNGSYPLLRQFRDVYAATNAFATIINNVANASTFVLATANSVSSVFNIEGCKNLTPFITFVGGVPTTAPIVRMQFSMDRTNWWDSGVSFTPAAAGVMAAQVANNAAKYARFIFWTAPAATTLYTLGLMGINGVN